MAGMPAIALTCAGRDISFLQQGVRRRKIRGNQVLRLAIIVIFVSLVGRKGEKMDKKQKIILASVFAAVIVIAGILAGVLNYRATQEGRKEFQVEIVSGRDGYSDSKTYKSDAEYLGEFLRTLDSCEWEEREFGIYIVGFDGMMEDTDNQYWWCVTVNGESSMTGADEIPLLDGDVYNFTLMQGW